MPTLPNIPWKEDERFELDGGGPGSGGGGFGPSGGSIPNPFIPTFGNGQAPGAGGMDQGFSWGPDQWRRRYQMGRGRMAFGGNQPAVNPGQGGMVQHPGGASPMGMWGSLLGAAGGRRDAGGPSPIWGPGGKGWDSLKPKGNGREGWGVPQTMGWLLGQALAGNYGEGGLFSPNPPAGIMSGIRGQAVQDAGARERSARLGLQARGDTDASTYGFQALMSQLGGQDQTARTMGAADLNLRQQQLQEYWRMLNLLAHEAGATERARVGAPQDQGFDWTSLIGNVAPFIKPGNTSGGLPPGYGG